MRHHRWTRQPWVGLKEKPGGAVRSVGEIREEKLFRAERTTYGKAERRFIYLESLYLGNKILCRKSQPLGRLGSSVS